MKPNRILACLLAFLLAVSQPGLTMMAADPIPPSLPVSTETPPTEEAEDTEPPPTVEPIIPDAPTEQVPPQPEPSPPERENEEEPIQAFSPEELGLMRWDDPARYAAVQTFGIQSFSTQSVTSSTKKLSELPYGTPVNIPITQSGSTWALPCVIMVRDHQPYGRGTVLRTQAAQSTQNWFGGGTRSYKDTDAFKWMQDTFMPTIDSSVRSQLLTVTHRQPWESYSYDARYGETRRDNGGNNVSSKMFIPSHIEFYGSETVPGDGGIGWKNTVPSSWVEASGKDYIVSFRFYSYNDEDPVEIRSYLMRTSGGSTTLRNATYTSKNLSTALVVPFFMLPNEALVKATPDANGAYDITTNNPPTTPASISYTGAAPGKAMLVTCGLASDPDGDSFSYVWEYKTQSSGWAEYGSTATNTVNLTVPAGAETIQVRVRTKDSNGDYSDYRTGTAVATNQPPPAPASIAYSNAVSEMDMEVTAAEVTDPDGDAVTYLWEYSVNGGEYTQFASTSTPKSTFTVPSIGSNLNIRVRAYDGTGHSAYRTGNTIPIFYGPDSPGVPGYGQPQAGQSLAISVSAAQHPNGLDFVYCWERSTDGGNLWTSIGESLQPSVTDYVPATGFFYRVRVRTKDSNNKYSEWAAGTNKTLNHPPTTPIYAEHEVDYRQGTILITWEPSTDQNLSDTISYTVDGKPYGTADYTNSYNGTSSDAAIPIPATGTSYLYRIRAKDDNGGSSPSYLYGTVTGIDRTPPTGTVTASTTAWTAGDVALTLTASDTGSGVKQVRQAGGSWVEGDTLTITATETGTYSFEIEDWNNNTATVSKEINNIDKEAPAVDSVFFTPTTLPLLQRFAVINKQAEIHVAASDSLSGIAKIEYQLVEDGAELDESGWLPYSEATLPKVEREFKGTVAARAIDHAGNVSAVVEESILIDSTPPELTFSLSTTEWTDEDVVITVNATDALSGVYSITLPDNNVVESDFAEYTATQNGTYLFTPMDNAGNDKQYSVVVSNIDKDPPTGTVTPSTEGWTNQPVLLSFIASAPKSGVKQVRVQGGEWVAADSLTFEASANGTYTFEAESNAGGILTLPYGVSCIDTGKPLVEEIAFTTTGQTLLSRLFSFIFKEQVQILITASDALSGVANIEYQLVAEGSTLDDDGTWLAYEVGKSKIEVAFKGSVAARATDNAGNMSDTVSETIILDDTPPELTYSLNTDDWTNEDVVITVHASDALSGVHSITLPDERVVEGDSTEYTATQNDIFLFTATDRAGNAKQYSVAVSNIDKAPPKLPELPIENTWVSQTKPIQVDMDKIEAPSGVDKVQYNVTSLEPVTDSIPPFLRQSAVLLTRSAVPGLLSIPIVSPVQEEWHEYGNAPIVIEQEGTFLVKLRAVSKAGNISPIDQYTVRNDLTPPILSHSVSGATITLAAADALSGVQSITLPDGSITQQDNVTFVVPTSGEYLFAAVDNAGNATEYAVSATLPLPDTSSRDTDSREGTDYTKDVGKQKEVAPKPPEQSAVPLVVPANTSGTTNPPPEAQLEDSPEDETATHAADPSASGTEEQTEIQLPITQKEIPMITILSHTVLVFAQCVFSLLSLLVVIITLRKRREGKNQLLAYKEHYSEMAEEYNSMVDFIERLAEKHPEVKAALEKEESLV